MNETDIEYEKRMITNIYKKKLTKTITKTNSKNKKKTNNNDEY